MTTQFPINVPDATPISNYFSMVTCDGTATYFHYLLPFDRHCANDKSARNLRIAKFAVEYLVTQVELAQACGIRPETVARLAKKY